MSNDTRVGLVPLDRIDFHPHNVRADLGDLRSLTESIRRLGVMQPVVVEVRGARLRIRAGHRRVAAARLAGLSKIPAVIHGVALEDDEWLIAAAHENTRRRALDVQDRRRAIVAMRECGLSWDAIADALGVSVATAHHYLRAPDDPGESATVLREDRLREQLAEVDALTREGYSAAQIGTIKGVTGTTVSRRRNRVRTITTGTVATFATYARERIDAGVWSAGDLLSALDALAATASVSAALGVPLTEIHRRNAERRTA